MSPRAHRPAAPTTPLTWEAVREAGNKTQLLYPSRDRDQDQGTSVSCTSNKSQTGQRTTSCKLNVISMACLHLLVMCTFFVLVYVCICSRLAGFVHLLCLHAFVFHPDTKPPWLSGRSILMLLFVFVFVTHFHRSAVACAHCVSDSICHCLYIDHIFKDKSN